MHYYLSLRGFYISTYISSIVNLYFWTSDCEEKRRINKEFGTETVKPTFLLLIFLVLHVRSHYSYVYVICVENSLIAPVCSKFDEYNPRVAHYDC
jgi:hypothetical protein